jgi:hypothetical protein
MKPLFTPEESARQARKLSDGINEVIRETFSAGLTENRRKLTPEQHAAEFGPDCPMPAPLEIDQAAADPIHDHRPQSRAMHKVNRVLNILDELDREGRIR